MLPIVFYKTFKIISRQHNFIHCQFLCWIKPQRTFFFLSGLYSLLYSLSRYLVTAEGAFTTGRMFFTYNMVFLLFLRVPIICQGYSPLKIHSNMTRINSDQQISKISKISYLEDNKISFSHLLPGCFLLLDVVWRILIPIHTSYSLT